MRLVVTIKISSPLGVSIKSSRIPDNVNGYICLGIAITFIFGYWIFVLGSIDFGKELVLIILEGDMGAEVRGVY